MNIVFLNKDAEIWIAYLDEEPSLSFQAASVKDALGGLLEKVNQLEKSLTGTIRRVSKYSLRLECTPITF